MGWIIVLSLAGGSLSLALRAAVVEAARIDPVAPPRRCPECGAQTIETAPFCATCAAPAIGQAAAGPGDSSARYAAGHGRRARRPGSAGFSKTRLRPGYDIEEADGFLEAVRDTVLGVREPPLTADEVRDKKLSTTGLRPGYDEQEVDAFLDEVEARLRTTSIDE